MEIREALGRLVAGSSLSSAEMEELLNGIMDGATSPAQIGGLLVALRMKGETIDELTGAARALRAHARQVVSRHPDVVDTCGTGGDASATFNISTCAALIAAGAGAHVAKHGNRAISGLVGGADVLEALGVRIDAPAETVLSCLDEAGFGFFFAPHFHPAMRHVAAPRRELGLRTIFNLLGPLANPAGARRQVVGVFSGEWTERLAAALGQLGCEHALVVHGEDGLDEISLVAPTQVSEWNRGVLRTFVITPEEFGLTRCRPEDLRVADREESVARVRAVLDGEAGPCREVACLNAAAALRVAGKVNSIGEGLAAAAAAIDSGQARSVLARVVERSQS